MFIRATTADQINGITANQPPPMASLPSPTMMMVTTSQNGFRVYATTHKDTARMVLVVGGTYTYIRVNKHKKEQGMRIWLVSLSRGRGSRQAWDRSNKRGGGVHWLSLVRFSSIRRMCLRWSLRVHR